MSRGLLMYSGLAAKARQVLKGPDGSPLWTWTGRMLVGTALAGVLAFAALIASFYAVPLPERLDMAGSPVVTWRDGSPAHVFLADDDRWRVAITPDEVDPVYVEALIRLEDKRFRAHPGVDPVAIGRAAGLNLARGRVVSGGSTLTMQVVRVLEPRPRTLSSKVFESWRAMQLEWFLDKDEILSAYLTFTPFGRNVEGVEAASWAYFGHGAGALSPAEIATLLAVPQAPTSRYPSPANRDRLQRSRDGIATFLASEGALPLGETDHAATADQVLAEIAATPVPRRLQAFPRDIPVVARWLRARHPDLPRIVTTLDRGRQASVERQLVREIDALERKGIHQGTAVVVDHTTGEVVALVGSLDPWGEASGDQVPMFAQPRSPGSALKPFIYAAAIDEGAALPDHLVRDIPASYQGYAPRNYDGTYDGLVRLDDALSRSLNLPFVFLLQEVGVEPFLGRLRSMGVEHLVDQPGWYGLSVAIGGLEVTPLELTGMYASLAEDGAYRPIRLTRPEIDAPAAVPVMTPGAAWLTRKALRLKDRPDFPARRELSRVPTGIHWKTGTSFGHRDAWACGSGPRHTACVWLGNADRTPSRHLVGAEASGAPLFNVLEAVADPQVSAWTDPPSSDLTRIEVDAWSGYLPTDATPDTRLAWALRDRVPTQRDPFHVRLDVDTATGEAVTAACRGSRQTESRTYVVFPASVRRWLTEQHRRLPEPPRMAAGCRPPSVAEAPTILSPAPGEVRVLIPGMPASRQEIALEADHAWTGELSWFVDGAWLGDAPADRRLWWTPVVGQHEVTVRDASGRTRTIGFEVRERARVAARR